MKKRGINNILEVNGKLVNYLTITLGIILIFISMIIGPEKVWGQVSLSVGASLLAGAIVVLLSSRYLLKQDNVKDIIEDWGLTGIYETRAKMNEFVHTDLEKNERGLDIIAFGLKGFRDHKGDLIIKKVRSGMQLRIITIDPESIFLKERENVEKRITGSIKSDIIQLNEFVIELQKQQIQKGQVRIRYYDSLPLDFYFGMDRSIYIGPYLYGIDSQQTISFGFESNAEAYNYYTRYFDKRWNDNEFCKEKEINSEL